MPLVGIRQLREKTSEVIRRVREERAEYVVTHHGQPVALILPLDAERAEEEMVQASKRAARESWAHYERLAEEIREAWPTGISTEELVDAVRR